MIDAIRAIGKITVKIRKGSKRTVAVVALILPKDVACTDEIVQAAVAIGCSQVRTNPPGGMCAWRERGALAGMDASRPFVWVVEITTDRDGNELSREEYGVQ